MDVRKCGVHDDPHQAQEEGDQPHRRYLLCEALPPPGLESIGSESGRFNDFQERILPAALLTKLTCISWNIEGKASVDQNDDLHSNDWTIAALQETGRTFSAGGHAMRQTRGLFSDRTTTTLLVHRSISGAILYWGGLASPWVVLVVDPIVFGFGGIAILSVYLPCVTSNAVTSDERWQPALFALYHDWSEAASKADQVIMLGDFNVSGLAAYLMASRGEEQDNYFIHDDRRDLEHSGRPDDSLAFLQHAGLRVLPPDTGFEPTFVPWGEYQYRRSLIALFSAPPGETHQSDHTWFSRNTGLQRRAILRCASLFLNKDTRAC